MLNDPTEQGLGYLAILADPVRRGLYLHVSEQAEPVSRDAAAEAARISLA